MAIFSMTLLVIIYEHNMQQIVKTMHMNIQ
jgi:hypothetical protein